MMRKMVPGDDFLQKLIQNKREINNTPVRPRGTPISKKNLNLQANPKQIYKENFPQNRTITNSKQKDRKSPLLKTAGARRKNTPTNYPNPIQIVCSNHIQKPAEFKILIDGQKFDYCNRCASHLASQGFQVERLFMIGQGNQSQRNCYENERKTELTHFLTSLKKLQNTYRQKLEVLTDINHSYEIERNNALGFYTAMMDFLGNMREEHLSKIQKDSIKDTQVCEIELGEIEQTLYEISNMKEDVEGNLNSIVDQVQQEKYRECMQFYSKRVGVYEYRLEELGNDVREPPRVSQEEIQGKLQEFRRFVQELTGNQDNGEIEELEEDL